MTGAVWLRPPLDRARGANGRRGRGARLWWRTHADTRDSWRAEKMARGGPRRCLHQRCSGRLWMGSCGFLPQEGSIVTADPTNRGACCSLTGTAIRTLREVGHGVRFEPPSGGRPQLIRPRLLDRLRQRFTTPVTLVAAPAGFGKTTLLGQAIEENRLAPRGLDHWLTCHADDGAASSLSDGLGRALGLEPSAVTEPVVTSLVEAMWHRSPDEVALVLDDVHEIPAHSAGAEVLSRLVASLPRNGHLVLSGREPVPVAVTRLEVQGQLLRVNENDLRFTDHELAEFAAQRVLARPVRGMRWLAGPRRDRSDCRAGCWCGLCLGGGPGTNRSGSPPRPRSARPHRQLRRHARRRCLGP